MKNDLAYIVKWHRKKSGLTQLELARLSGVGRTVIFDIEHGKQTIQWDTLSKVLPILNISIEFHSPLLDRGTKIR